MTFPKLSIITVNLNNAAGLQKTLQSVISQTFRDFQYIVIDGGSTDASKTILEGCSGNLNYWVSEMDSGIYNAMNKGIAKASGEYLLFLNSGDWLINDSVLQGIFTKEPDADIIYGDIATASGITKYPDKLSFSFFFRDTIAHPAAFIRRKLFERYGNYNEQNKLASDWEFFLQAIVRHKSSYYHAHTVITFFDVTGVSSRPENAGLVMEERKRVLALYFPDHYPELAGELNRLQNELNNYKNSRIIQTVKKIMGSKLYRFLLGRS